MRNLIISFTILLVMIITWSVFFNHASDSFKALSDEITTETVAAVEKEDWKGAMDSFDKIKDKWKKYHITSMFFLENEEIIEVDLCIAKSHEYISAHDVSNSAGELKYLSKQLSIMAEKEELSWHNIL